MSDSINIYEKLQKCRVELQGKSLKKSGENKFAKYTYYELGDFLPTINNLFHDNKLFSRISFDNELASLTIINIENPSEEVTFTSPMSSAQLKGCHEIQNLGAVETYQRRYLYMAALEIVEHDALDATTGAGKPEKPEKKQPKTELTPKETMFVNLKEINVTGKEKIKEYIKSRIGREISSSDELTEAEIKKVAEDAKKMKGEQNND